jgi:hypothetical protein
VKGLKGLIHNVKCRLIKGHLALYLIIAIDKMWLEIKSWILNPVPLFIRTYTIQYGSQSAWLKGLSHEIDFKNVDSNLQNLA